MHAFCMFHLHVSRGKIIKPCVKQIKLMSMTKQVIGYVARLKFVSLRLTCPEEKGQIVQYP